MTEPQSVEDLLRDFKDRIAGVILTVETPSIATLKERRQNVTAPLPWPSEHDGDSKHCISPLSPIDWPSGSVAVLWSTLLQPVDALLSRVGHDRVVPIKVSSNSTGPTGASHRELLTVAIRGVRTLGCEVVTLLDLCRALGYAHEYTLATSGRIRDSSFFEEVKHILTDPDDDYAVSVFDDRYRTSPADAELAVKFIPERGDIRAYTIDRNPLRELVGSAVHSIMHPQDRFTRQQMSYTSVWRVKHKNLISEDVVLPHVALSVGHGDVSSFTSSFAAVWQTLISSATRAEQREVEESLPPIVLSFGRCLVEAPVCEILRLFIFLAFRMKVLDTVTGEEFVARGGMLGVSGINTTACVTFAGFWRAQCPQISREHDLRSISCYMGGDDFRVLLTGGTLGRHSGAWERIKTRIQTYIGALSQEALEALPIDCSMSGSVYLRARFCKKVTYYTWCHTGSGIRVQGQSQFRIPLHRAFLKLSIGQTGSERRKLEDFIADLVLHVPWIEEQNALIGTIYRALNILHGPIPYFRRERGFTLLPTLEVLDNETIAASEYIDAFPTPCSQHWGLITADRESKKSWLIRTNRLRLIQVTGFDYPRFITYLPKEASHFVTYPGRLQPIAPPTQSSSVHVAYILGCVVHARLAVGTFDI